jgi:hypothetical protein
MSHFCSLSFLLLAGNEVVHKTLRSRHLMVSRHTITDLLANLLSPYHSYVILLLVSLSAVFARRAILVFVDGTLSKHSTVYSCGSTTEYRTCNHAVHTRILECQYYIRISISNRDKMRTDTSMFLCLHNDSHTRIHRRWLVSAAV